MKKIILADDFEDYAKLLENQLRAEGYQVLRAADGELALALARSEKPDLIILDIMMPKLGGTEVQQELSKDPSTREIPIIFLTGLRAPHSKKKRVSFGARMLGKSSDFNEILQNIRELLI